MNRRETIIALVALGAVPLATEGQNAAKVARIGYLAGNLASTPHLTEAFIQGLRDLGYVEGRNVVIEYRDAAGRPERYPALAAELVALKVDVIVAASTPAALAAKSATSETPIVFSMVSDPVASGIVASLSRPGGNLTGWSNMLPETSRKLLELLKEVIPKTTRFAVLFDPANDGKLLEIKVLQTDAQHAGLTLRPMGVRNLGDIKVAFAAMRHERPDGLVILQDTVTGSNRKEIVELAANARLPAIYQVSDFVDIGGLMSYGLNRVGQYRRSAVYVDKILRGAKPGDLPVEQPTAFELVINLKAAKALGVAIPQSILLRADRLIE